jgi:arylsulfatase A-like enzyme
MSPEQYGDEPVSAASDQFSFCAALYEALCGYLPFAGTTAAEQAVSVRGSMRPAPLRAEFPEEVLRILARGLSADHRARFPSMMDALREGGYRTHAIGKMHFSGQHYGLNRHEVMEETQRFRVVDDYLLYLKSRGVRTRYPQGLRDLLYLQPQTSGIDVEHAMSTWVADRSIAFLREHLTQRGSQPFFLWSSWIAPHPPFAPCDPYAKMYDPQKMPAPVFSDRPLASLPSPAWAERARLDGAHLDTARMQRLKALYYGQITHIDDGVGRILKELERLGLSENTVIIFTSDHGEMMGDHGLGHKSVPYEGSMHVPMLMRWPGRTEAGRVCGDLVGLTDVMPTLLDGLGLQYPGDYPHPTGASLIGAPGGGLAKPRESYVVDFGQGRGRWVSVRTQTHKYVLWAAGSAEELYDLQADPQERQNLAQRERGLADNLRAKALAWERTEGLPGSFEGGRFRTYPAEPVPTESPRTVVINEARWPDNLPAAETRSVESYGDAFTRAISRETTLSPGKLSLGM